MVIFQGRLFSHLRALNPVSTALVATSRFAAATLLVVRQM